MSIPSVKFEAPLGRPFTVALKCLAPGGATARSLSGRAFFLGLGVDTITGAVLIQPVVWPIDADNGIIGVSVPYVYLEEYPGQTLSGQLVMYNESSGSQEPLCFVQLVVGSR